MTPSITKDESVHTLRNSNPNFGNDVREAAVEVKDNLRATANNAGRKVRGFIDSASDEFEHARESVTSHVNEKPMQSSLIALGIGFVLGALFRR